MVQPAIDACLDIAGQLTPLCELRSVTLTVHPLSLDLCGRRHPSNPVEAQLSLFHWAAACLVRRSAGLGQLQRECLDDPLVQALRGQIVAQADGSLGRAEARAEVVLGDGQVLRAHVPHARGSLKRPMTDVELDAKFMAQAVCALPKEASDRLLSLCREVSRLDNVGSGIAAAWADCP